MDLDLISAYSILAPTVLGAIFYFKVSRFVKILFWLVVVTLVAEIASLTLFNLSINNMSIFHVHTLIEFGLISLVYNKFAFEKYWKTSIAVVFVLFVVFSGVSLVFHETINDFNSLQRSVEGILLIIYSFAFIRQYSEFDQKKQQLFKAIYRMTYGYLIYFVGTSFLFFFGNEILNDLTNDFWSIHGLFNIFLNVTYCIVIVTSVQLKAKSRS